MVTHMPLSLRKALCGRVVFLEAARPHEVRFIRQDADESFTYLQEAVFNVTKQAISGSPDTVHLDSFLLNGLLPSLRNSAETQSMKALAPLVNPLVSEVETKARGISCEHCSPGHVCNGRVTDDEIVANGGECISPFRAMFDVALEAAKKYYVKYATQIPACGLPEVRFSTAHSQDKPHDCPVDFFVGGATSYGQEGDTFVSDVKLTISVDKFDWKTNLATPYVLFHECICHAFQGLAPSNEGRGLTDLDDAFAEGWMDWVAYQIMAQILKEPRVAGPSSDEIQETGAQFHYSRYDRRNPRKSQYARRYFFGVIASRNLFHLLQGICEPGIDPWQLLLRMSFDLNLLQTISRRNALVELIASHLPDLADKHRVPNPQQHPFLEEMIRILRNYMRHNDIFVLLADIDQIVDRVTVA